MEFIRRNINKKLRNGEIIAYNNTTYSFSNKSGVGSSSSNMGSYLPATSNGDGTYTVDLTQVIFNGNVIAQGEVAAYKSGLTSGETSGVTSSTIDVEDNLTSDRTDAALSANQGRVLKDLIDNIDVENLDLSNYYTKAEVDYKLINFSGNTDLSEYVKTSTFNSHSANTTVHVTTDEKNKWNDVYTDWNDVFEINSDGSLKVKVNLYGNGEISAYGSGTTANTEINLENYYTKSEVDDLIDNIDVGDIDLSEYSKTSHTHSNYAVLNHAHNYASTVKVGTTSYNVTSNTISLPSYPTLSSLSGVSTSTFNSHSGNTTLHITAAERTNWNAAYTNNHTHSNKTVLDGITATKVSNWDKVYSNWNNVFEINSNGDLRVKVNVIGDKEISAYGSVETSSSSGVIDIVDNLTSTSTTAALSANQGRVLKGLIDGIDVGDIDLSGYSKTSHTHSNYSLTSHTHSNYSTTSHTHSQYASSSHSHSNYSLTSHTHSLSALTSTAHTHSIYYDSTVSRTANTVLAAPNGKAGGATFRSLVAADIPSLAISKITNLQSSLDAKSGTGHSHSNYSVTSHTHNYAGSSSAGGAATSANKVNSTLTFSGGTFATKTFNGSAAVTVNVPTHTSHITNNSGYITTASTVAAANKVTSTLSFSGGTFSANSFNGSAAKTVYVPTHTSHITNNSGYITTGATVAKANQLTTARTLWRTII